jgi:hypothetical protein
VEQAALVVVIMESMAVILYFPQLPQLVVVMVAEQILVEIVEALAAVLEHLPLLLEEMQQELPIKATRAVQDITMLEAVVVVLEQLDKMAILVLQVLVAVV